MVPAGNWGRLNPPPRGREPGGGTQEAARLCQSPGTAPAASEAAHKGDSLGRISLEVREGMDPEAAEREARALGKRYAAETEALFRRYTTDQVTFEFKYGTEYANHPNFGPYLENVRAHYDEDASFQQLVHAFGDEYLARTMRSVGRGEAGPSERLQRIAREYLIEEIALLACFAADGWPALVYPGSIDSIIEIAEGRYPALPAPLKELQFIALRLDAKSGAR